MSEIVLNLLRRKGRTLLTVTGIFIGILALTILGAMSERFHALVEGNQRFFAGQIRVLAPETAVGRGLITPQHVARIETVSGVEAVTRRIEIPYPGGRGGPFGIYPVIHGIEFNAWSEKEYAALPLRAGRPLRPGDRGTALVGAAIAEQNNWRVGDVIDIAGNSFRVIGILHLMMSVFDHALFIPIEDARVLLLESMTMLRDLAALFADDGLPILGDMLDGVDVATGLHVHWQEGTDPEALSRTLQATVPELTFVSPATLDRLLAQRLTLLNTVVFGTSLIALLVGGLSIVNTMTMAVNERRGEIAVKKALGASTAAIVGEFVAESALLGLCGGVLGVAGGCALAAALNAYAAAQHTVVFLVTGRMVAASIAFSVVLGALAGWGPALHAARLHPVDGLREE